jgi:hypothetical protein
MLIKEKINLSQWQELAAQYPTMIKLAVDIEKGAISAGGELHSDCLDELLEDGASGQTIWGANIYPADKKIDFVSLINIRPGQNNRSMEILIPKIRQRVEETIKKLLL